MPVHSEAARRRLGRNGNCLPKKRPKRVKKGKAAGRAVPLMAGVEAGAAAARVRPDPASGRAVPLMTGVEAGTAAARVRPDPVSGRAVPLMAGVEAGSSLDYDAGAPEPEEVGRCARITRNSQCRKGGCRWKPVHSEAARRRLGRNGNCLPKKRASRMKKGEAPSRASAAQPYDRTEDIKRRRPSGLWGLSPKDLIRVHHILRELCGKVEVWQNEIRGACALFPGCTPDCLDDPASDPGFCVFRRTLDVLNRLQGTAQLVVQGGIPKVRELRQWSRAQQRHYTHVVNTHLDSFLRVFSQDTIREMSQSAVIDGIHGFDMGTKKLKEALLKSLRGKRRFIARLYYHSHDETTIDNAVAEVAGAMVLVMAQIPSRLMLAFRDLGRVLARHPEPRPPNVSAAIGLHGFARSMTEWADAQAAQAAAADRRGNNSTSASAGAGAAAAKRTGKKKKR